MSAAIVIALNVFFYAGLETFYPAPDYNDFCPVVTEPVKGVAVDEAACHAEGANWVLPPEGTAYCDMTYVNGQNDCYLQYDAARVPYDRNTFILFSILGLATILVGLGVKSFPMAVGRGLMYGGIVTMFIGTTSYWNAMDDLLRFAVSAVVLAVLVVVGVRKLKD